MKLNKWTMGLAAVGAVTIASAVRADEAKLSPVQTAVSNTTISGSVSSTLNWQMDPSNGDVPNSVGGNIPFQGGKANGWNLDVVKLSISKPQDESPWASGYQVDLLFGPDAIGYNPTVASNGNGTYADGQMAIQQAYIALRTPVGNGIDLKLGVFNTIIGYESTDASTDPNYTRSWGWAVEPTEHTGLQAQYKFNDMFTAQWGVANTLAAGINSKNTYSPGFNNVNDNVWHKTLMGAGIFTAPSNWGWAAGSQFTAGVVYGFANTGSTTGDQGGNQANYYAGATLNSPWKAVTFGATFDYVQNVGGNSTPIAANASVHADDYIFGLYNTIKATDKLSFNSRVEYWEVNAKGGPNGSSLGSDTGASLTETVQYDMWQNVISRLEFRYDKIMTGSYNQFIGYYTPTLANVNYVTSFGVYANVIYKF